jgi:hypothetical protein
MEEELKAMKAIQRVLSRLTVSGRIRVIRYLLDCVHEINLAKTEVKDCDPCQQSC